VDQTDAQGCFQALFGVAMVGIIAAVALLAVLA
jgi:hypothetical protein